MNKPTTLRLKKAFKIKVSSSSTENLDHFYQLLGVWKL